MENIEKIPRVSVIIPTYNRAQLIERAVSSVLEQTFTDWELIIVDDGSRDDTVGVIKKIQEKDSRIFFYKNEINGGAASARNIGIKMARGEYVAFLDSDDVWMPNKLAKQVEILEKSSKKVGLVYTSAIFANEKSGGKRVKKARIHGDVYWEELAFNPIGSPSRVMLKRECLDVCGNFDENFRCSEDWDLWIRISEKYEVVAEEDPLVVYYEDSPDSVSINKEALVESYEMLWKKYNVEKAPRWVLAKHYVRLGHRLVYYGDLTNGRKYLRKAVCVQPWNPVHSALFLISELGVTFYRKVTFYAMKNTG